MRNGMKWLKRILIALVLLLIVAAAVPFLVPLGGYLPQIEKQATAALGQPVQIKSIRLVALPLPHVTLSGITVGKSADLKLDKVRVTPDLLSLLGPTAIIHNIELDGLTLTRHGLEGIAALARQDKAAPAQPPAFRIENIRLDNAQIELGKVNFGPLGARVGFDGKGMPERATLSTHDGKLKATIRFGKAQYLIDASAKTWTLPVGPPLLFDELDIKGTATGDGADFSKVSAALYGGRGNGKATVDWRKGMHLEGKLDINHLELQQIAAMLSPGAGISGKLDASPVFSASAASASQLADALQLETKFDVQQGVLHGVDIKKAASSMIKQPEAGGETRFDELSGHLVMAHGGYQFTQLKIGSSAFTVDGGEVNISPEKKLSGRIHAKVAALGSVPLNVGGTVDSPLLYPTGGTMTGAAIGTMILGPGVGTSVGAKVGGFVEGLFGKKKEEKPKK